MKHTVTSEDSLSAISGETALSPGSELNSTASSSGISRGLADSSCPKPRYQSLLPLADGGMANVVLAVGSEAGNFKKLTVLKILREELAADPDLIAMFLSEARLCARLNHANLVQVLAVMEAPRPCIVMEYLEGLSMFELHRELGQGFATALQLQIISDVLAGLHYAHELCDYDGSPLGIVHRDVSPQNVIVTSEGRVKVLDFGIAKVTSAPSLTQAGVVKGKMSYMSPEQLAGDHLDRRTDVYAVGCMLWRAATGQKLWANMSSEQIMRCLVMGKIPPPSTQRYVDPRLEEIVVRATAPSRADRYESAAALRRAVDDYLAETAFDCDLYHWMQSTFKEHWDERRRVIRASMSERASRIPQMEAEPHSATAVTSIVPHAGPLVPSHSSFPYSAAVATTIAPLPKSARLVTVGIVAAAVGVLLVGAVGLLNLLEPDATALGGPRIAAANGQHELLIRLRAEPLSARISIDGAQLLGNPAEFHVAAGSEHSIEIALSGHETVTRKLRFDRPTALEFVLMPKEANVPALAPTSSPSVNHRSSPKPTSRQAPAATLPSSALAASAQVDDPCEVPFYYVGNIKTFKPECLREP